ncbi:MAG: hypothetical protein IJQ02_13890 [Oscillospiraceae bacterium]|nr:hypothetical protein [Oscillospiraceae bacterium]
MEKEKKFNSFSVPLGLLDYINPILYTITMVTVIKSTYGIMEKPFNTCLLIGAIISIFFGFVIPTGKVIVGLGLIKFVMPVSLVFCVNTGILISGLMLFHHVMDLNRIVFLIIIVLIVSLLTLLYFKSRKINTVAVLTGAVGYVLIYTSLILLSVRKGMTIPIILYALAIMLFVILCGIGIKANLKNPRVHWVIEISNVMCQLFVAIATILLFS